LIIGETAGVEAQLRRLGLPPTPASLAGRGSARVWVVPRDGAPAVAIVAAEDETALRALLRPLPHYGRQSFLVFEGSRLAGQGVWPAEGNPLRRVLR
jgi:hypothetical protein